MDQPVYKAISIYSKPKVEPLCVYDSQILNIALPIINNYLKFIYLVINKYSGCLYLFIFQRYTYRI